MNSLVIVRILCNSTVENNPSRFQSIEVLDEDEFNSIISSLNNIRDRKFEPSANSYDGWVHTIKYDTVGEFIDRLSIDRIASNMKASEFTESILEYTISSIGYDLDEGMNECFSEIARTTISWYS